MRYFLLLALLLTCLWCTSSAQQNTSVEHLDILVNQFVAALKSDGVDTICIYQTYFESMISAQQGDTSNGRCNNEDTYIPNYIFWTKGGKTFLHKMDNCFDFQTIDVYPYNLWTAFFLFKDSIRHEVVKPFSYHDSKSGAIGVISSDHTGQQEFRVIHQGEEIKIHFDSFDLELIETYGSDDKKVNDNYGHNISLKSKYFADQLKQRVQETERRKLLIKARRP